MHVLAQHDAPSGSAFVLGTARSEPRLIAQLDRDGAWDQRALDAPTSCAADRATCALDALDVAPLGDGYVWAISEQPAASGCRRLRLALSDQLLSPHFTGGEAPGSLFAGVHLDAAGCTGGGASDARVAALGGAPTRDVLLTWRSDEPLTSDAACAAMSSEAAYAPQGAGYIAALNVSVPADGYGLFSDERESLHCLGRSAAAPSLVAAKRAVGYFVAFLEPERLRVQFVRAYGSGGVDAKVQERARLPLTASDAARLTLSLSADETLLAARWTAGDRAFLAAFDVSDDGALHLRTRADVPTGGAVSAPVLLARVETGLLDWARYENDAGWLLMWLLGGAEASQLMAARISDRTGQALEAPAQVASGRLSMPLAAQVVSGAVYGFVRRDESKDASVRTELALQSTECVAAARP